MIPQHKALTKFLFPWILLIGLILSAGCSNAERDVPQASPAGRDITERVTLSKHACIREGGGLTPYLPQGVNMQVKAPALAGGTVQSGDFLISIYLICDPILVSDDPENPEFSWQEYSEVRYLGLAYAYEYLEDPPEQEIKMYLIINKEYIRGGTIAPYALAGSSLSRGSVSSHYGPILTEDQVVSQALSSGEPIDIMLTFSSFKTLAAVRLTATFEETPDGYRLLSAEIGEVK